MSTQRAEHLKITQHKSHTEVEVLQPCAIRWSVDGTIWMQVLSEVPAGTKFRDFDAPEDRPRNYVSVVNGQTVLTYYHREAARAFAEQLAPWFEGETQ